MLRIPASLIKSCKGSAEVSVGGELPQPTIVEFDGEDQIIAELKAAATHSEDHLRQALAAKDQIIAELKAAASFSEGHLRQALAAKDQIIAELKAAASFSEGHLRQALAAKERQIEELRGYAESISSAQVSHAQKDSEIKQLRAALAMAQQDKDQRIAELKAAAANSEQHLRQALAAKTAERFLQIAESLEVANFHQEERSRLLQKLTTAKAEAFRPAANGASVLENLTETPPKSANGSSLAVDIAGFGKTREKRLSTEELQALRQHLAAAHTSVRVAEAKHRDLERAAKREAVTKEALTQRLEEQKQTYEQELKELQARLEENELATSAASPRSYRIASKASQSLDSVRGKASEEDLQLLRHPPAADQVMFGSEPAAAPILGQVNRCSWQPPPGQVLQVAQIKVFAPGAGPSSFPRAHAAQPALLALPVQRRPSLMPMASTVGGARPTWQPN
ncbi:unnamed protein product [Polarella glacialis]|uniref:Uncharacterized protein n=1 Tax=Polarella glacialis TaxID=89957 RepID=A0A813GKN4_POLGL|nr:unnamed protein product [Polarella glacialis]